jgi:3-dehydroquinate synthase
MSILKTCIKIPGKNNCPVTELFDPQFFAHHPSILLLYDANVKKYAVAIHRFLKKIQTHEAVIFMEAVPPGEQSKSLEMVQKIATKYAGLLQKNSLIVCIGGGMVCDLGGFIAASLLRGIDHILIPTTLLAQIDAAIGGKTAVNLPTGKNLLGFFHLPKAVLIRSKWLNSLNKTEMDSGWGELLKTAAIDSAGFFNQVYASFLQRPIPPELLHNYIKKAIHTKKRLVRHDFLDKGQRRLLNFGHTIGHAIEAAADCQIPHGICIMAGMAVETDLGLKYGLCSPEFAARLWTIAKEFIPFRAFLKPDTMLSCLCRDKKNQGRNISFALLKKPGCPVKNEGNYTVDIPVEQIKSDLIPLMQKLLTDTT